MDCVDDLSDMVVTIAAEDVFDASPELHRIAAPTLLVAGERDRFGVAGSVPGAAVRA